MIIAPSLLSADWTNIKSEIEKLTHPSVRWIHFDVMDGKFVSKTTYTPKQLKEIKQYKDCHWDVHLMVNNPVQMATLFAKAGADSITFHYESILNPERVINHIKSLGL